MQADWQCSPLHSPMQSIKSSKHRSTHDFGVVVVVVVVVVAGVVVPVDGGCVVQGPLSMVKYLKNYGFSNFSSEFMLAIGSYEKDMTHFE